MATLLLPRGWKIFFYIEVFLLWTTGIQWILTPDFMYTIYGFTPESSLYNGWSWSLEDGSGNSTGLNPVTPQQFAAITAGQLVCLSNGYMLLRMLLQPAMDSTCFRFIMEGMTLADVAQVLIAGLLLRNGIAVNYPLQGGQHVSSFVQQPATIGVLACGGLAALFGIVRAYFIYVSLPGLLKRKNTD